MNISIIKKILAEYRKGISVEDLESLLKKKRIKKSDINNILKNSNVYKLNSSIIFLKTTLLKHKDDFFKEFDDFLISKISDEDLRKNILNSYLVIIPDNIFYKWIDISLTRKLMIFDLLFNFFIKSKNNNDALKIFFNEQIEYYAYIVINLILLSRNHSNNIDRFISIINEIEPIEESLKKILFETLTEPEKIFKRIDYYKADFKIIQKKFNISFRKEFNVILHYSKLLFRRVINNEINNFDFLSILTRFKYNNLYEWIMILYEEKIIINKNLYKDLDL